MSNSYTELMKREQEKKSRARHKILSRSLILNDESRLQLHFATEKGLDEGLREQAEEELQELEHFLNHGES